MFPLALNRRCPAAVAEPFIATHHMKERFALLQLSLTLLVGVADETPRPVTLDKDMIAILKVAKEFRPEGAATVQVERVPGKDMAYVRYSIRRDGHDVVMTLVTLRKTSRRWEVESCAR